MSDTQDTSAPEPPAPNDAAEARASRERIILALCCFAMSMVGLLLLVFVDMAEAKMAIVAAPVGGAIALFGVVINWRFGSSAGSAAKDGTIADVARMAGLAR